MSITVGNENGVGGQKIGVLPAVSQQELRDQTSWLVAAEPGFLFWDNREDAVYDQQ